MTADQMVRLILDNGRCPICGWTLAATAADGCVVGNCCYRPGRGEEQRTLQQNRETFTRVEPLLKAAVRNPYIKAHLDHLRHGGHPDLTCALIGMVASLDDQNRRLMGSVVKRLQESPAPHVVPVQLRGGDEAGSQLDAVYREALAAEQRNRDRSDSTDALHVVTAPGADG